MEIKHWIGVIATILIVISVANRSNIATTVTNTMPKTTPPLP